MNGRISEKRCRNRDVRLRILEGRGIAVDRLPLIAVDDTGLKAQE